MDRRRRLIVLGVCALLFAAAAVLALVFTAEDTPLQGTTGHVVLNEILAANRTYPAPNGQYLDFIEVRNCSDTPTDISGYMLSDDSSSIGYTFPSGTVLEPYGYALCWCWKEGESGEYAAFGISSEGKDVIYLYNSANVQVDSREVPILEANTSLARQEDGSWAAALQVTPGFENSEAGYAAWLASVGADSIPVVISEVMTGNDCTAINESYRVCASCPPQQRSM